MFIKKNNHQPSDQFILPQKWLGGKVLSLLSPTLLMNRSAAVRPANSAVPAVFAIEHRNIGCAGIHNAYSRTYENSHSELLCSSFGLLISRLLLSGLLPANTAETAEYAYVNEYGTVHWLPGDQ